MISTIMPAMVRDIGGVELNGWTFAIYEIGSIIAGAATGRLTTYWSVRTNLIVAALVFTLGTIETALSPTMYWALIGRLISGFGGGALISLSFVAVQRYFPSSIWPQLMAVLSVVWGVSAFGGPLYGGLVQTLLSWRWAFLIFAAAAVVFAIACVPLLRNEPERPSSRAGPTQFSGPCAHLPCAWASPRLPQRESRRAPMFPWRSFLPGLPASRFSLCSMRATKPPACFRQHLSIPGRSSAPAC